MVLFNTLDPNLSFSILKRMFSVISWDSKTVFGHLPVPISTTFISSYDFIIITQVFSILKLYLTIFAVYSGYPSSFRHLKPNIWRLYDDLFLPSHFFSPL